MSAELRLRVAAYAEALRAHVGQPDERTRGRAYELGRGSVGEGGGLLHLAAVHQEALAVALRAARTDEERERILGAASEFLLESLAPVEMTLRGYHEANETLRTLNADLERIQRDKDELAALVVHDLKNPLAAILVGLEFVHEDETLGPDTREAVGDVVLAAESMRRLVVNLLDVSRSEDGALTPRLVEIDLATHLVQAAHAMERRAACDRRVLSVEAAPDLPALSADPEMLARLLENLLDNALKYAPEGTGIRLEAALAEGEAEIRVRDRGPGVPPAYRERIFEKFVQLDPGTHRHARTSRGLGLVFCKRAVEVHGGRIWIEDNPDGGSCFCVRLPLRPRVRS